MTALKHLYIMSVANESKKLINHYILNIKDGRPSQASDLVVTLT